MHKIGASQVVLYVILIFIAVSGGAAYFMWFKQTTEKLSESTIEYVEGSLACTETYAKASGVRGCNKLTVTNNGAFTLQKIALRIINNLGVNSLIKEGPIAPEESKDYMLNVIDTKEIEVLPIIKTQEKLVGCKDKTFNVQCQGLTEVQKFTCKRVHPDNCDRLEALNIVTWQECCSHLLRCCAPEP